MRRLAVLALLTGVLLSLPGVATSAAAAGSAVALVVDFGDGRSPLVLCTDESGLTDAQVTSDLLAKAGLPGLRWADSGLLCGIDGYPASGCGDRSGARYAYWAYFHGGAVWSYAQTGPVSHLASAGDVIGFRFEAQGSGTPADPTPREAASAARLCPSASSAPGATTTVPASDATSTTVSTPVTTPSPPITAKSSNSSGVALHTTPALRHLAVGSSRASSSPSTPWLSTVLALGAFGVVALAGLLYQRRRGSHGR